MSIEQSVSYSIVGAERLESIEVIDRLVRFFYLSVEDKMRRIDPSLLTFFNVNTREDMERAERMLAEKSLSDMHTDLIGNKEEVEEP
jgi:GTP:adenosylcobinamide-phosphate guanylyltransferase